MKREDGDCAFESWKGTLDDDDDDGKWNLQLKLRWFGDGFRHRVFKVTEDVPDTVIGGISWPKKHKLCHFSCGRKKIILEKK